MHIDCELRRDLPKVDESYRMFEQRFDQIYPVFDPALRIIYFSYIFFASTRFFPYFFKYSAHYRIRIYKTVCFSQQIRFFFTAIKKKLLVFPNFVAHFQ